MFSLFGAIFGFLFGGFDGLMYTLLAFVLIDYLTGVLVAIKDKNLNSKIGYAGLFKKVMIFLLVIIGNLIDVNIICQGATFRTAVIFFYISNEGISIIENAGNLGLPIPKKLLDVLAQLKAEEE
ncbi:MAG: phage holin family protein [Pseudobutyrivibrio sp.]|nr:phage holin family protein [Pseudobutyrivibrio sp.]